MIQKYKGELLLLLAALVGGAGFISMKYLLEDGLSAFQIIAGRFLVATICMGIFYRKKLYHITLEEWKAGGLVGGMLFLLFALMTVGLKYTTPAVNAFLVNTQAVVVPFILWVWHHKKPDKYCIFSAILSLVGVALLSASDGIRIDFGAMLSLLAAVAFAFQMVFLGGYVQKFDPIRLTFIENMVVFLLSLCCVIFLRNPMPQITVRVMENMIVLGVFCTAIYFVLQSVGQQTASPSKTAVIITLESVFATIMSVLIYGEKMTVRGYVGCIVLFVAVLIAEGVPFFNLEKVDG
jgi:drug/metabolite transporter (DMT)-like permease